MFDDNTLNQDSRDLTSLVKKDCSLLPLFREQEVAEAIDAIIDRKSILLVGPARSGKTSVVLGIADALRGKDCRCLELTSASILVGTKYLGEWPTKLRGYVENAKKEKAVLYFVDVANLAIIGQSANDKHNALDMLRPEITSGEVVIVGEVTLEGYKDMLRIPKFADLFHRILIEPLSSEQVDQIVSERATEWIGSSFDGSCHQHLKELTENFTPPDFGPGTRLELLQRIQNYAEEKQAADKPEPIKTDFIDKVFSMYTGLPKFVFSRNQTVSSKEIRKWFRNRIFGQEQAIEAVVESITLFKSALRDPNQPIGTFLFTGPTGVGKTELSKALAEYLYGSSQRLLRFDMSEYASYDSFQMLIGQGGGANSSALLIDPVRAQPFQVILFDEIEKGHQNIYDLLLQLLDEGRMSQVDGRTVDFRNTIVICTTNAGAAEMSRPTPGFTNDKKTTVPLQILERYFRPEFLNRFQHVLVFHPLDQSQVRQIAEGEVKKIIKRSGIVTRNLIVDIESKVIDDIAHHGYSDRYGARALKREVQRRLALPIGSFLMENAVAPGALVTVTSVDGRTIVKSFSDAATKKPAYAKAVSEEKQRSIDIAGVQSGCTARATRISKLESDINISELRKNLSVIDDDRGKSNFWNDRDHALQQLMRAEQLNENISRVERLANRAEDLKLKLADLPSREQLAYVENASQKLDRDIDRCELELLLLGDDYQHSALILVEPVGDSSLSRNELYDMYFSWSRDSGRDFKVLFEPVQDSEPAMFAIGGPYAYGYLVSEAGLHRHRIESVHSAAKLHVAPYLAADPTGATPELGQQRALKQVGHYGGKIRSLVEIKSTGISLQNDLSLVENREIAGDIDTSWRQARTSTEVIRRYDAVPFFVKDYASDVSSGRRTILRADGFSALLSQRARLLLEESSS